MWLIILAGLIGLGIGFGAAFLFYRSTMESAQERGNLAKRISALPYVILDFLSHSKFNALSADDKVDFITDFFRRELRNLRVAAYTPTAMALDDFYKRRHLDRVPRSSAVNQSLSH